MVWFDIQAWYIACFSRALVDQLALVPNTVCQRSPHEGPTAYMGSVLLWWIYSLVSDDNGHVKNEGIWPFDLDVCDLLTLIFVTFWCKRFCFFQRILAIICIFNPFPHTTILQQTTLNVFCQNIENLYNWRDNLWQKVENIVTKGEIACFVQFLLLLLCFQKAICYRGVRKRLYERKG